ncbi:MAG: HD domain-containing protein [Treponema sp.]|jgi:putative two-component system response regulator|nr:HD domain-containing protein [Treponema sp.]
MRKLTYYGTDMGYMVDEEYEILEELDETEKVKEDDDIDPEVSMLLSSSYNPFKTSFLPVLIINKNLKIIYSNESCENMFSGFTLLNGKYFFDLFGKAFKIEDARKIRDTILNGGNGFSWKGSAQLKTRNASSVQIRVYIFPLEMDLKAPSDFVIMFDDFTEDNKKLLRSVFLSLLEASKLKDNDTGNHTIRVNEYSKRFSEVLYKRHGDIYRRIDADFIDNIGFLAAMHDVGKIGTPDDILNKKGPLSDWEWAVMREHTKNGAYILSTYPNPMAKEIALSHHEKWNGTGYPFQLEGEMIPLAARIVTIADVYDALRMERSYKPTLNHEITRQKIIEQSGTFFDPNLIEIFKEISEDFAKIYDTYKN